MCVCVSGVTALLVLNQGCGRGGRVTPWENGEGEREITEREREESRSFCDRELDWLGGRFNVRMQERRKRRMQRGRKWLRCSAGVVV